jgi:glycosyltransferase involved in cell wall biosynthesis
MNNMNGHLGSPGVQFSYQYPLTVVIPTYNRAKALISCFAHLERQTWMDFEVIVVDDGSSDETPQKVYEYQERTNLHMRFHRQANGGPARARNRAISMARSPLVLMIGDDIFAAPELVETHLRLHQQRPEDQVAGLGLTLWDETMQKVTSFMRFLEEGSQFAYHDLLAGKRPSPIHFYTSNLSVKTGVLLRNPFCERFPRAAFEDIELGYRLAQKEGLEIVFMPEARAHHFHPTTFVQACGRMRHAGWAAHMMYELCPEVYVHPAGKTAARRFVRRTLALPHILDVITGFSAVVSRFFSPKIWFRAVLGTHFYLGYRDRELQTCGKTALAPASQAGPIYAVTEEATAAYKSGNANDGSENRE